MQFVSYFMSFVLLLTTVGGISLAAGESLDTLAQRLKTQCTQKCQRYTQAAQGGSMRATYEAAFCTCNCFYQGVPADYPQREQIKQCAIDNSRKARELGSTVPVFRE